MLRASIRTFVTVCVLFHVQTEDSARASARHHPPLPRWTILASEKRSYPSSSKRSISRRRVREVMDASITPMLGTPAGGELDEQMSSRLGADVFSSAAPVEEAVSGPRTRRLHSEPEPTIPPEVVRPFAPPRRR